MRSTVVFCVGKVLGIRLERDNRNQPLILREMVGVVVNCRDVSRWSQYDFIATLSRLSEH